MVGRDEDALRRYIHQRREGEHTDSWRETAFIGGWTVYATQEEVSELSELVVRWLRARQRPTEKRDRLDAPRLRHVPRHATGTDRGVDGGPLLRRTARPGERGVGRRRARDPGAGRGDPRALPGRARGAAKQRNDGARRDRRRRRRSRRDRLRRRQLGRHEPRRPARAAHGRRRRLLRRGLPPARRARAAGRGWARRSTSSACSCSGRRCSSSGRCTTSRRTTRSRSCSGPGERSQRRSSSARG